MEPIQGSKLDIFPFQDLEKVSDLLYFEGPLLMHYKDSSDNNYLFYWMDFDDEVNRWLVLKVDILNLFLYLDGQKSLRSLISEKEKDFAIVADVDEVGNYVTSFLVDLINIDSKYLPEENAFYAFELNSIYAEMFKELSHSNEYIHLLRQRAINFRVEPLESKYSTSVSLDDAVSFMRRLKSSFNSYIETQFKRNFEGLFFDSAQLAKALKRIIDISDPRIVGAAYGSFEVSLATDTIMADIENLEIKAWQESVIYKFKSDVIDMDFSSVSEFKSRTEELTNEEIRKIYSPILQIANSPNYSVEVQDRKSNELPKRIKRVPARIYKEIIPKVDIPVIDEEVQMQLLNVVLEVVKGKNVANMTVRELKDAVLFAESAENVTMKVDSIITPEGERINLTQSIQYNESLIDNLYSIKVPSLEIEAFGSSHQGALNEFMSQLYTLYFKTIVNVEDEGLLTPKMRKLRQNLIEHI